MPKNQSSTEELSPEALEKLINKRWGANTMRRASDPSLEIKRIPCGILSIDQLLGGGFARGRHTEIFGSYAVGKTATTYYLIASAQEQELRCCFIDVEGSFDPAFAEHLGVDLEDLSFHEQEHGNRVIDFMETLLRSRQYDVVVLDSIAALLPKSEMESDMERGSYGTEQAKLMSAALRRLTAANKDTVLIYINQTRDSVGSVFQKKAVTSGGRAMSFYAGTRIEMVRVESIKRTKSTIDPKTGDEKRTQVAKGHRVLVRINKDKTGSARQDDTTTFVFDYGTSQIDHLEDLIYLGRVYGLVHKKGNNWWVEGYDDEKKNGRPRFKKWLNSNRAVTEELEEMIVEASEETEEEEDDE